MCSKKFYVPVRPGSCFLCLTAGLMSEMHSLPLANVGSGSGDASSSTVLAVPWPLVLENTTSKEDPDLSASEKFVICLCFSKCRQTESYGTLTAQPFSEPSPHFLTGILRINLGFGA